nr:hypothetical protein [Tanacetum cinerariifolium]
MKGSCKRLIDLEYHLEEVYKATTDQLDWVNPEDYGHIKWIEDLVPREMWIQQPINYNKHALWGISHWGWKRKQFYGYAVNRESARDVYSKKRIIAVTELHIMEWHDYKHLDWISFYGYVVNRESARDVYSKRRIIAVTDLHIMEWNDYKYLDWISVSRDDDQIYKFKEGDFKRLRLQDIEDMLLLLVQGKLSNLTVEERLAFNVSLRMFTRSIVIQRCVEDLQLGVESYQKKLNLMRPDTYRSDLKQREAYTAYFNPRGFIYQNKDKKNRLMRIDELHKFSDGTLNDVRNALMIRRVEDLQLGVESYQKKLNLTRPDTYRSDLKRREAYTAYSNPIGFIYQNKDKKNRLMRIDELHKFSDGTLNDVRNTLNGRLKGIRMHKMLKTRRIMRSLEKFVGGRLYEGDLRMLQRTI